MIQIPGSTYQRSTDAITTVRPSSDLVSVQQATPTVQRIRAARDRRVRYERRSNQAKAVLVNRRLSADRRNGSHIDILV